MKLPRETRDGTPQRAVSSLLSVDSANRPHRMNMRPGHCTARHALGVLALLACAIPGTAAAQYPARLVSIVVPFPAGGSTDITARTLGQKLGEAWGQQVVIENRGGAGGNIGTAEVARSAPDGYRILVGTNGTIAVNPSLYRKLPFDVQRDLAPVGGFAALPLIAIVHPSVPVRTLADLAALARARPGQINYGSGGNGTQGHLCAEIFRTLTGINIVHVPYKGSVGAITDLVSGQVSLLFAAIPTVQGHIAAGRLRALAVLEGRRTPAMPDLPTAAESGVTGFEVRFWNALFVRAGTPPEIIARINADVGRIVTSPEIRDRFRAAGADPMPTTPRELETLVEQELARYARVVRDANMRLD